MSNLKKNILISILGFLLLWVAGFLWFVTLVNRPCEDDTLKTQAIIALTGGVDRLATAVDLLKQDKADKLLISGVNQTVDWPLLSTTLSELPDNLSERIFLGHIACDTRENALEGKYFMEKNGFTTVKLVTASYHMPRSMAEFKHIMPDLKIVPHPVFPEKFKHQEWWKFKGTTVLLLSEYTKFLLVSFRNFIPYFNYTITINDEVVCSK